jgi:putative endonuclease
MITSKIGKNAEDFACMYLRNQGYVIQEQNWRFKNAEIDIICQINSLLVFVEVKSRAYTYFGEPESTIDIQKEERIIDAAMAYMRKIKHNWAIRFDIISIQLDSLKRPVSLKHFKDAFF